MNKDLQDRIDQYLRNQMSLEERRVFDFELEKDPELKETVELQRLIAKEIRRQSFMEILEEAESEIQEQKDHINKEEEIESEVMFSFKDNSSEEFVEKVRFLSEIAEPKSSHKDLTAESDSYGKKVSLYQKYKWQFLIAASLIGVVFIIWQPNKSSNQDLFNSNAYAYSTEAIRSMDDLPATRGEARGEDVYFDNLKNSDNLLISDALSYYDNKDYNSAKLNFEMVLFPKGDYKKYFQELTFYMSISQLLSDDAVRAIENLEYLATIPGFIFSEESNYYLALAYLESDQRSKARTLLNQIRDDNRKYSQKASDILNKLRWL